MVASAWHRNRHPEFRRNGTIPYVTAGNAHASTSRIGRPTCGSSKEDTSATTNNMGSLSMTAEELMTGDTTDLDHYDLVCVGFGPASLAIAIALHDRGITPRVRYLERQKEFIWHGGMLLPDARMQISFLKDLATLRDPTSKFTFINYLRCKNRLVAFTNLSTFLPLREEYNDYMKWCASHFDSYVGYEQETSSIAPVQGADGKIGSWRITSKHGTTGEENTVSARHVVIAIGGKPKMPAALADLTSDPRVIHSSAYNHSAPKLRSARNVAVVGGGQSGAEIFNNLQGRLPNTKLVLYTGASTLKPSDDSPFVNEVFDPDQVDTFYDLSPDVQKQTLQSNRATNYGVVRPELLDRLYESMYHQRLHEPDESKWQHKIIPWREVMGHEKQDNDLIRLRLRDTANDAISMSDVAFDLVVVATGYRRDGHETLLAPAKHLLEDGKYTVARDYKVRYKKDAVSDDSGIWLQGCNEGSHGLSDTLLSILAVRGGEMADSIFPEHRASKL